MTEYTPELHAHLAELNQAGSPAPWHTDGSGLYGPVRIENNGKILTKQCVDTTLTWEQEELDDSDFPELEPLHPNAVLVKEARNALPALLAYVESANHFYDWVVENYPEMIDEYKEEQ